MPPPRHTVDPYSGELLRTSPSAIETFLTCETAWWLRYVAHAQEILDPKIVKAQNAGTEAHAQLEAYLLRGTRVDDHFGKALLRYAPAPCTPGIEVETNTYPLLVINDIPIVGRIDLTLDDLVADWKTRSDLKYSKSTDELRDDIQMNLYAAWLFAKRDDLSRVRVSHLYAETKYHRNPKGDVQCIRCGALKACSHVPRTDRADVTFTRAEVEAFVEERMKPALDRMRLVAKLRTAQSAGYPENVGQRGSVCWKYGGCGYKHCCPHQPGSADRVRNFSFSAVFDQGDETMSSLQELLEKRKKASEAVNTAPASAASAPQEKPAQAPTPAAVEPALPEAVEISGEVFAPDGKLVPKANVHCEGNPIVVTDANGRFTFPNKVPVGPGRDISVSANAPGFAATAITVSLKPGMKGFHGRIHFSAEETGAEKATPGGIVREDYAEKAVAAEKKRKGKAKAEEPKPAESKPETSEETVAKVEVKAAVGGVVEKSLSVQDRETRPAVKHELKAMPELGEIGTYLAVNVQLSGPGAANFRDLAPYVRHLCAELAERDGRKGGVDPRWVMSKDSPLAYGGWRGALTELINQHPPDRDMDWYLLTLGDEVMQVAAAALAALPGVTVIAG